jgi:hypothetical protein
MDNQLDSSYKKTEFFLLASYSCLPTVVNRLIELESQKTSVIFYCFTTQLYEFLLPLIKHYDWINVFYIDDTEIYKISLYRPWKIFSGFKLLNSIFHKWFAIIPPASKVNFYNRYYALTMFFMVWKLRNKCEIHFTDCDHFEKIEFEKNISLYATLKKAFLYLLYPMPFEFVSGNDGVKPFPALNKFFLEKTAKVKHPMISDLSELKHTKIFRNLSYKSDKKILWLMSPVLDLGMVPADEYKQVFRNCVAIVNSYFPSIEQAVKYHPRTIQKEIIWNDSVECIPKNIPIEFLDLPNLQVVLAFSTSSFWSFPPNIIIIGLIDILPFISTEAHEARRQYFTLYKSNSKKYSPSSLNEFSKILSALKVKNI